MKNMLAMPSKKKKKGAVKPFGKKSIKPKAGKKKEPTVADYMKGSE